MFMEKMQDKSGEICYDIAKDEKNEKTFQKPLDKNTKMVYNQITPKRW